MIELRDTRLIIFDADGTLVSPASGGVFRRDAADWELLPGRRDMIFTQHCYGITCAIASNQGGCAFGYADVREMKVQMDALAQMLQIPYRLVEFCPYHPDGTVDALRFDSAFRKPRPGMLERLMLVAGVKPEWTLMVGDRLEDQTAAALAGCRFAYALPFFGELLV